MASNSSWNDKTGALEVASTYSDQAKGKIVLVTGTSIGGIGDAIARGFAHGGASTVILTGRSDEKLSAITEEISKDYPNTRFRPLKLDLNSLAETAKSAKEILEDASIPQIDFLVTNAGGNSFSNERKVTADGIETHIGQNHLAHFHFVNLLLPKLRAAAKKNPPGATRIVILSSAAQGTSPIRWSDFQYEKGPDDVPDSEKPDYTILSLLGISKPEGFEANIAYGQSKTANTLHAVQLNKLLNSESIYSFSIHPGLVNSTGVKSIVSVAPPELVEKFAQFGEPKTIDQGAGTVLVAALDPGLKPEAGVFLTDSQIAQAPDWAVDAVQAEKLWKLSEDLVKEKVGA